MCKDGPQSLQLVAGGERISMAGPVDGSKASTRVLQSESSGSYLGTVPYGKNKQLNEVPFINKCHPALLADARASTAPFLSLIGRHSSTLHSLHIIHETDWMASMVMVLYDVVEQVDNTSSCVCSCMVTPAIGRCWWRGRSSLKSIAHRVQSGEYHLHCTLQLITMHRCNQQYGRFKGCYDSYPTTCLRAYFSSLPLTSSTPILFNAS